MKVFIGAVFALSVCAAAAGQGVSASTRSSTQRDESRAAGQPRGPRKLIPGGCTLYLGAAGDWEQLLADALAAEKVPLVIVPHRSEADYEALFPKEVPPQSTMIVMDARMGAVLMTESLRKRDPQKAAREFAKRLKAIVQ